MKDETGKFIDLFISMGDASDTVDTEVASNLVCQLYAQHNTKDVNEARCNKLKEMTGKIVQV